MYVSPVADHSEQSRPQELIPPQARAAFFLVTGLIFLWVIPNNFNDVLTRQFMSRLRSPDFRLAFSLSVPLLCYLVVAGYGIWRTHSARRS